MNISQIERIESYMVLRSTSLRLLVRLGRDARLANIALAYIPTNVIRITDGQIFAIQHFVAIQSALGLLA